MQNPFPNKQLLLELCGEQGLFGPQSLRWDYYGYRTHRLAVLSASILQIAHPVIAKAVAQTREFETHPLKRTLGIMQFLRAITYGNKNTCLKAAENLWAVHTRIQIEHGGQCYEATNPELLCWVWMTSVAMSDAFLPYSINLKGFDWEQSYQENTRIALACGVPQDYIPQSHNAFQQTYENYLKEKLQITAEARKITEAVFALPTAFAADLTSKQWSTQFRFLLTPFDYYCALFAKALLPATIRSALSIVFDSNDQAQFQRWCQRVKWVNTHCPKKLTKSRTNLNAYNGHLL